MVMGLDADHSSICKFENQGDDDYSPVWRSIKRLIDRSMLKAQEEKELLSLTAPAHDTTEPVGLSGE